MTKNIATVLGLLLIIVGLLGFAAPTLMGMHLTLAHNLIHLVSGALALYFGLKGTAAAARSFCIVFGAIYALLGIAGFAAGGPDRMLTLIPDQLVLGMMDHIIHLILGAVFLVSGLYKARPWPVDRHHKEIRATQRPRQRPLIFVPALGARRVLRADSTLWERCSTGHGHDMCWA
jgi:uncharacterized membrane protein HdeD (DUF308 family)